MIDKPPFLMSNDTNDRHMEAARTLIDVASIPAINHPTAESIDFGKVKFHDVLLTDDPTNIVSSNNKNVKTKLQSIMSIAIDKINTAQIRNAAKSLGIKGCRKLKKLTSVHESLNGFQMKPMHLSFVVAPKMSHHRAPLALSIVDLT